MLSKNKNVFSECWELLKSEIKNKYEFHVIYEHLLKSSYFLKNINSKVYIVVSDSFFIKEALKKKETKLLIDKYYSKLLNFNVETFFILESEKNLIDKNIEINQEINTNNKIKTFNNYIVGKFNKFLYESSLKLIHNQNSTSNVMFIYGNTGLGKTHLLNEIINECKNKIPDKKVKYLSTEEFLRDVYSAFTKSGIAIEEYKNNFTDIDILLMDDVQFLTNKNKLNEVYFNIFNNLISKNKKIIMTSDKPPELINIDERMISRFNSGITIKIPQPDIETVKEIIISKINSHNRKHSFSNGAINFLANRFNNDIRVLEGKINTILFYSENNLEKNKIINEEYIKNILNINHENNLYNKQFKINPNIIIEIVANAYSIPSSEIISKKRTKTTLIPRKICMYIIRKYLNMSYSEIGNYFSNRDHSTIINSINNVSTEIKTNNELKEFIENIISKI